MTDKQIIDKVNVKECKYYCNGKCERYGEFVEADYDNYSVKCICEEENVLGTYDICDYQQLSRKEQECEELKEELHQNFKEKDGLHLIIDRLLEASGYDTNTASAEDFEDVYENMRYEKQQLDQLKAENEELKKKKEENTTFYLKKYANKDSECLELEHKLKQAEEKLKRIREFATALCYTVMSDGVVILQKDILKIIDEVENAR